MRPGRWRAKQDAAATGLERGGFGLSVGCAQGPRIIQGGCDLDRVGKLQPQEAEGQAGASGSEASSSATKHPSLE